MKMYSEVDPKELAEQLESVFAPRLDKGWYLGIISDITETVSGEADTKKLQSGETVEAKSLGWLVTFTINKEQEALEDGWQYPDDAVVHIRTYVWVTHVYPEPDEDGDWVAIPGAYVGSAYRKIMQLCGYDWKQGVESYDDLLNHQMQIFVTHSRNDQVSDAEGFEVMTEDVDTMGKMMPIKSYEFEDETCPPLPGWKKGEKPNQNPF